MGLWRRRKASSVRSHAGLSRGIEVDDELFEFMWEGDWWEEEMFWQENAPGGTVCWITGSVNISCGEDDIVFIQNFMYFSENAVGFRVSTPARPPAFHNARVVAEDFDSWWAAQLENGPDEEFHGDSFCPANVFSVLVPPWEKPPGLPSVAEDNAEASG